MFLFILIVDHLNAWPEFFAKQILFRYAFFISLSQLRLLNQFFFFCDFCFRIWRNAVHDYIMASTVTYCVYMLTPEMSGFKFDYLVHFHTFNLWFTNRCPTDLNPQTQCCKPISSLFFMANVQMSSI